MGISGFEQRLERGIEGFFGRVFRSGLRPVELGRKLVREMDDKRTVGVNGRAMVPNSFRFTLSQADHDQLADMVNQLRRDLADAAREHARDEQAAFAGPVEVEIVVSDRVRPGLFRVQSRYREAEGGAPAGSLLLPTGDRVPLGEYVVTVGRAPDATIMLGDPNVSRRHAEIRPQGDGFVVVDLASTNGTRVNGARISEHPLRDRDEVVFGNTVVHFEAS
ncbi:MAG: FHA domain-containing protein [Microthrixaceae bacterium]|nr:FHA domain-containing protein [Microthrixaceae bacterium]